MKVSRKFSDAGYKPRWKKTADSVTRWSSGRGQEKTADKQCHPVELEQRGREPSVMGGCDAGAQESS